MPVSPKSQKKSGAPKAKGAVRAKSGCYTCRIRRKKCDERPNADNCCETCVRLKLECLGFGAKRPEWLRDNRNVLALREKIKNHLASQGMIKGHSGSGPRNSEHEPVTLRLGDDSSSTASPQTPTLSLDEHRPRGPLISSERDTHYHLSLGQYDHPSMTPSIQELSPDSPIGSRSHLYPSDVNEVILPPYQQLPPIPHNLVPISPSSAWPNHNQILTPAMESSFGQSYTYRNFAYEEDDYAEAAALSIPNNNYGVNPVSYIPMSVYDTQDDQLVAYYLKKVVNIQYLLADENVTKLIFQTIESSATARNAVYLLASLHRSRTQIDDGSQDTYISWQYKDLCTALQVTGAPGNGSKSYSEGEAMAGLHLVSTFLFVGGKGDWSSFLNVSLRYSWDILNDPRYDGPRDALMRCGETARFIVKTSMWFDVLASASQQKPPHFLELYRDLFSPVGGTIDGSLPSPPAQLCMLPIMGCENHIVWALAEISNLAFWKDSQTKNGRLSMPWLIGKGHEIERHLSIPPREIPLSGLEQYRYLTSEIFRASARVYLHSVLSGDYPSCPEIAEAVGDTIECLKRVVPETSRSVVRSVVFSIFICGCLTDDIAQRSFLRQRLEAERAETVGNCPSVISLLEQVWKAREYNKGEPVRWREVLLESGMLLV